MPKFRALPTSDPRSIEECWHDHDELGMLDALICKYARVLDMTNSGRDIKPLATGLLDTLDKYHAMQAAEAEDAEGQATPLAEILQLAK